MTKVRMGVIGLGNMGQVHTAYINQLQDVELTAVCDADAARANSVAAQFPGVKAFTTHDDLLASGTVDAILIATPHYQHPIITDAAFARGIHVLCEKPVAVRIGDARRSIELHKQHPNLKYGLMFQTRTIPVYLKIKQMIADGELGAITRITWLATAWFRTWTYYAIGSWRGTWKGEGGGVLINQNPHNLDLLQWLPGMMPSRITAVVSIGKTHPIQVEDEVSAILEYPNGATGHFITSTGEFPGTDRLEIAGERGKLICENGKIKFHQTIKNVREVREKSNEAFAQPEMVEIDVPTDASDPENHKKVTQNFIDAITRNVPLIAPGEEGANGLEIGNAMLLAGVRRTPVDLPLASEAYEQLLVELDKKYGGIKKLEAPADAVIDMKSSFKK